MEDTNPRPFVFVLMPFADEFSEIYELGIKTACSNAGAYCERVDEQTFDGSILTRIYNQIAKADIIVSDMTNRNPNVFYETGYAHALNKQVILLTQKEVDIPFDLKHYPHIIYKGKIIPLQEELETRVRWCIKNPKTPLSTTDINLDFFLNGTKLVNDLWKVEYLVQDTYGYHFALEITLHNVSPNVIEAKNFELGLIAPRVLEFDGRLMLNTIPIQISHDQRLLPLKTVDVLYPDGWRSFKVPFLIPFSENDEKIINSEFNLILRFFTAIGPKDTNFTLKLEGRPKRRVTSSRS